MCREEQGAIYPAKTLVYCLKDELVSCKQANEKLIDYMDTIKLKIDVITSQHGNTWIPGPNKDELVVLLSKVQWPKTTYKECTLEEYTRLDTFAKDRLVVFCGIKIAPSSCMGECPSRL